MIRWLVSAVLAIALWAVVILSIFAYAQWMSSG